MMKNRKTKPGLKRGVTLVELVVVMAISVIPVSLVGVLLVGGHHKWEKTFNFANRTARSGGPLAVATFGRIGRKSRSNDCELYFVTGGSGLSSSSDVVLTRSEAVEFSYLIKKQGAGSGRTGKKSQVIITEYAFFYLDEAEGKLKVDYNRYPRKLNKPPLSTIVLAENVVNVQFSRTNTNNADQGCVRMTIGLKDPESGRIFTVMAATLMRS